MCPVYSGVKAFISSYLEKTRNYMIQNKISITVTDITRNGLTTKQFNFIKCQILIGFQLQKTAQQIIQAIEKNKESIYNKTMDNHCKTFKMATR